MKDRRVGGCFGCTTLIAGALVCVGFFQIGTNVLWYSLAAFILGSILGGFIGKSIGIASGGTASSGSAMLSIVFGIVFVLATNIVFWATDGWWSSATSASSSESAPSYSPTLVPVSTILPDAISYEEIEHNRDELTGDNWDRFKRSLLGKWIKLYGVVKSKSDGRIDLYVGQDYVWRRIFLDDLTDTEMAAIEEKDFVSAKGRIYQVTERLRLDIYVTDVELQLDTGKPPASNSRLKSIIEMEGLP